MIDHPTVFYASEPSLDVADFRRVLVESGLGAVRPIDDEDRLTAMLAAADLILTARYDRPDGPVVGILRCITDFAWCCYVSDLAVSASTQGLGIGKSLLDEVRRQLGPDVSVFLVSVPGAVGFYESIGMARVWDAFLHLREH